jgi:putative sterol carrier protein
MLKSPFVQTQIWIQIVNGEMQAASAMLSGTLKIKVKYDLLEQFQ